MTTIVWDVDDVLNELTRHWFERQWRAEHPGCPLRHGDLTENPPHRLLGVPEGEYLASLDRFRLSPAGRELPVAAEVRGWFEQFGPRCRHIALTARPLATVGPAAAWVCEHFGRWVRAFGFVPSPRPGVNLPDYGAGKKDWLAWIGQGDVLVDDSVANVQAAASLGLRTVLFPQPWNRAAHVTPAEALRELTHAAKLA